MRYRWRPDILYITLWIVDDGRSQTSAISFLGRLALALSRGIAPLALIADEPCPRQLARIRQDERERYFASSSPMTSLSCGNVMTMM